MAVLKVTIDGDKNTRLLVRLLKELSFVKDIREDADLADDESPLILNEPHHSYGNTGDIKDILSKYKGKGLFKDIHDPSEWQRQMRREWEVKSTASNFLMQ